MRSGVPAVAIGETFDPKFTTGSEDTMRQALGNSLGICCVEPCPDACNGVQFSYMRTYKWEMYVGECTLPHTQEQGANTTKYKSKLQLLEQEI